MAGFEVITEAEGNLSQLVVRNLIALILYHRESSMTDQDFNLYEEFAERLGPRDIIVTFNYDTILEKTFSRKQIRYRLFPTRFESVNSTGGVVRNTDEIVC